MKKLFYFIGVAATLMSCEDVIEVDLPKATSRPVADAILKLDTTQTNTNAIIKLSLSSSFFEDNQPLITEEVVITNLDFVPNSPSESNELVLSPISNTGVYQGSRATSFFTLGELTLSFQYNGERYFAKTQFVPSSPIENLEQGDETLFTGDETEVIISFIDDGSRDDFYIFFLGFGEYLVTEDIFYQGQRFEFSYFYEDIEPGEELNISIIGADETFYNYMNQVIVQSGGDQGPFQTPAATVRGNIFNVTGLTNPEELEAIPQSDNFALGYFAVVQEYKSTITIE